MHSGAAETLTVEDTRVEGQVNAPRDGVLFTSIPCDSGWRVYIDGEPVKASAVAGALIAVPVSAGEHTFRLEFIPRGLRAGAAVSTITLLGMCTAALTAPMHNGMRVQFLIRCRSSRVTQPSADSSTA